MFQESCVSLKTSDFDGSLGEKLPRDYHKALLVFCAKRVVAYLRAADIVSGPLASRLRRVNQPVIRTRNAFSPLRPRCWAAI